MSYVHNFTSELTETDLITTTQSPQWHLADRFLCSTHQPSLFTRTVYNNHVTGNNSLHRKKAVPTSLLQICYHTAQ